MEQVSLENINRNVEALRLAVSEIREILLEDELELSDEVIDDVERSKSAPESDFVSQEDVETEFL